MPICLPFHEELADITCVLSYRPGKQQHMYWTKDNVSSWNKHSTVTSTIFLYGHTLSRDQEDDDQDKRLHILYICLLESKQPQ
jgi:hypothetical protein